MPEDKCIFVPIFLSQGYRGENANEILKETKKPYFFHEYSAIKTLAAYLTYTRVRLEEEKENEEID
ncbi:hypothetical protein LAV79_24020 [Peribacillus butanolivorans]|uniref:hypothetical protein n=1 Tax=Peribacillus butanolivorans TaxID=421767 RepID=UPI0030C9B18C